MFGNVPSTSDLAKLQREYNEVDDDHKVDDQYYIEETSAHKINLTVRNNSNRPLKNSIIELVISRTDGLNVLKQIKNYHGISPITKDYPEVSITYQIYIKANIGDIKHHISSKAFAEPLRMFFDCQLAGSKIIINCTLHAENLPKPFKSSLEIVIV